MLPPSRDSLPRYAPWLVLPATSYVPGGPHPRPQSHAHLVSVSDLQAWEQCLPYLEGIDLFNHGYYWEAHEAWEAVWHAAGRTGPTADFFKALIKLAAAGVKVREGIEAGVRDHLRRAVEILQNLVAERESYFGIALNALLSPLRQIEIESLKTPSPQSAVAVVWSIQLLPATSSMESAGG